MAKAGKEPAKFATFKDMFKWNKTLMEDGHNEGLLYHVKHKAKLGEFGELETVCKIADKGENAKTQNKDSYKVTAEHKVTGNVTDFDEIKFEIKGKKVEL